MYIAKEKEVNSIKQTKKKNPTGDVYTFSEHAII